MDKLGIAPKITEVAVLVAGVEPPVFVAVTVTLIVCP
jgi:hypothetical protein